MPKKKTSSKKTAKKPAKKAKASKKKDKEMIQTHAKEEKFQPSTLDQVWGESVNTRYGELTEEEYSTKIKEMNTTDLQAHAHMHGLVPIQDRTRLTKSLISEFKRYVSGFQKPATPIKPPQYLSKTASQILSEGR